jgi:alpha-amylase
MSRLRIRNSLLKAARRAAGLGALALSLSSAGCMQFDDELAEPIELGVHVQDWREEIIYQVLVDRFADGDSGNNWGVDLNALGKWHGGDWRGLEERLPYLDELGVTTLWISPAVKNVNDDAGFSGYHGYWTQDFTEVNPHYGDLAALRRLVRSAHERDMKVILDIVTNHVGQVFYYDINKNGQPDKDVFGGGQANQSPVVSVTEYDPEFDPRGIQARTSLGESGPAPVIFQYDPASNHVPPLPSLFQDPAVYNRKGRTFNFDELDQLVHGDFPGGLKDVDTSRCDVKRAMVDVFVRWIELTDIDGFRIDTLKHVEHEFWRFFAQNVRLKLAQKGKTNFYMFGEAFDGNDELIGSFTKSVVPAHANDAALGGDLARENAECPGLAPIDGHMVDGVFYFSQLFQVYRDVFRDAQPTAKIKTLWDARPTNYGTEAHPNGPVARDGTGIAPTRTLVNFIDNHDIPRFLYDGPGASAFKADGKEVLKNALLLLLTQDGLPCIYYGTEQGFRGGNDPANREDLWQSGYATDGELFQWIARLTRLRKGYKALTLGEQKVAYSTESAGTEEDAGMFAIERALEDGSSYALVVFNTHPSKTSTASAITVSQPQGTVLVDVLSAEKAQYTVGAAGALSVSLPAVKGALLIPEKDVNPAL